MIPRLIETRYVIDPERERGGFELILATDPDGRMKWARIVELSIQGHRISFEPRDLEPLAVALDTLHSEHGQTTADAEFDSWSVELRVVSHWADGTTRPTLLRREIGQPRGPLESMSEARTLMEYLAEKARDYDPGLERP